MLDRIKRLALQALDKVDSSGNAARWLLARGKGRPVQTAASYDLDRLRQRVDPPLQPSVALAPSLADIMDARDLQLAGKFHVPYEMAARMNSDDAIFVARQARLAPIEAIRVAIEPADDSGKAGRIAGHAAPLFGQGGSACSPEDDKAINRDLADHGLAIGINQQWCPRPDGSGIDVVHRHWPLRDVEWDAGSERLIALVRVDADPPPTAAPASIGRLGRYISSVPIVHGDGRWVVYQNQAHHSWQHDAAVLAGFLVWARHAFGASDWAAVSRSHGSPKWLGTLPQGMSLQVPSKDAQGEIIPGQVELSPEAKAYLDLLGDMASLAQPYGVQAFGSKTELMINTSTAWQVFSELMTNAEKAAARIWTGTDALLGAQGGAPGIDISALFGVASTIIQGDLGVIARARHTGVIVPWTALNYGTSARAPQRVYQIPDPDLQRAREELVAMEAAYVAAISARRAANLLVSQEWADDLADRLGVARGELAAPRASGFALSPTGVEKLIDANEGRSSIGLPPKPGGDVPMSVYGQPVGPPAMVEQAPASGVRGVA
jgi:hypothetical protein